MSTLMLVLRVVHIVASILWGGGAFVMEVIIRPAVAATGENGQQFSSYLTNTVRIHIFMMITGILTILAGVALYWIDSNGFSSAWLTSGAGLGFGVGAVFGVIAFVFGALFGNANRQLGQIHAKAAGQPAAEQHAKVQKLQRRIKVISPVHIVSMLLAMTLMATARYLTL